MLVLNWRIICHKLCGTYQERVADTSEEICTDDTINTYSYYDIV